MPYTLLAVLFSVLWASAFIAVKVALRDCPPLLLMASRFLVAGGVALGLARMQGRPLPASLDAWRPLVVLGLLNNALYLGITAIALQHVSAGLGAVLASMNPVVLALLAPWFLGETLTARRLLGLAVSFGGVTWVMWSRIGDQNQPWAVALFLPCVAFLVTGTIVFKRLRITGDLLVLNGGQLLAAGLALLGPALLLESPARVRLGPGFLLAQAYLILVVSGGAMLIWFWLLAHGDATRASAYFFLNPVIGLFLGALLLGEPLAPADFLGSAAVGLGIYVVQRG